MADFTPNEGELEMQRVLLGLETPPALYIGLFGNSLANIQGFGDAVVYSDLTLITNVLPVSSAGNGAAVGAEWQVNSADWSSPLAGSPHVHPQIEYTADAGGANPVCGYYMRSANNKLWIVGINPEVEGNAQLKQMLENAKYRVNPLFNLE